MQIKQIPLALGVLSREIDRNPDDPGLYERLAVFLDQNRLGSQQEEIYRRAMARFPDKSLVRQAGSILSALQARLGVRNS